MKAKDRLAHWLASKEKNYSEAVDLFIDLNIDTNKIGYFSDDNPDKVKVSILTRQLERYARVHGIKPRLMKNVPSAGSNSAGGKKNTATGTGRNNTGRSGSAKLKIDTNPVVRFEKLPVQYQEKFKRAGELANENKTNHAELKFIKDDPAKEKRRKYLAQLITNNITASKKLWNEIDEWWEANSELTPEQQAAQQAVEKEKRIRANKNYIKRYHGSTKQKQIDEVKLRKAELDKWGVDYVQLIGEHKPAGNTGK